MLIKFNFRFGWLWLPCISVGLFLVIYDAMSYIGAPFLYIHKIDYFFSIVIFSNFWKISDFRGKNCQFCEYKKSELQYNSWHHERPEKNLLAFVGTITYWIWIKSIFWNCFLHCALNCGMWMTKYIIGEFFSSGGATLYKNPDQTVYFPNAGLFSQMFNFFFNFLQGSILQIQN